MNIFELPNQLRGLALRRQEEAGNTANEALAIVTKKKDGGFDWHDTPEGVAFWKKVHEGDFQIYFKKYDIDGIIHDVLKEAQIALSEHTEEELRRALKKVLTDKIG